MIGAALVERKKIGKKIRKKLERKSTASNQLAVEAVHTTHLKPRKRKGTSDTLLRNV